MAAVPDLSSLASEPTREDLWTRVCNQRGVRAVAEIGVYRGHLAEVLLGGCPAIETYYLVDPWRHLDGWDKPANHDDEIFARYYQETLARTEPWATKRVVLRGRTTEVLDSVPDGSLDLAYVDADHTLRGVAIDLFRSWPKVREGGILGGDDLWPSIWQHGRRFEPSMVFPFAIYFAEAVDSPISAFPGSQFLIEKSGAGYSYTDHTGKCRDTSVRAAIRSRAKLRRPLVRAIRRRLGRR